MTLQAIGIPERVTHALWFTEASEQIVSGVASRNQLDTESAQSAGTPVAVDTSEAFAARPVGGRKTPSLRVNKVERLGAVERRARIEVARHAEAIVRFETV